MTLTDFPEHRLIAVDLDDTLLDDNLKISPRNKQALQKAAEMGLIVTLATGRMFRSAKPYAVELGVDVPIITYQGALIKDTRSGQVLAERPVPLDLARSVLKEGYLAGVHMNVYLDDILYVDKLTPEGLGYTKTAGVEMFAVGNLLDFLKQPPTKILYVAEPELLDTIQGKLQKEFKDILYITKSKPQFLEFMHPQASKGQALRILGSLLGIKPNQMIAVGDSFNDLDMLELVGLGIAVGNAPEEIKLKADYVTATNNDDGVAEVVEKFILSNSVNRSHNLGHDSVR